MELLLNPVVLSIIVLTTLCLLKFNIIIAIILSTILAGLMAGMQIDVILNTLIAGPAWNPEAPANLRAQGMGGMTHVALSYVLLGALAYGIQVSGLASKIGKTMEKIVGKSGTVFLIVLTIISSFSQNLIPIHIAFIPILIPPLLKFMNGLKLDRRVVACVLTFGLKAPYILIPAGFGLIFHNILATNMYNNGMPIPVGDIWPAMVWPAGGMLIGLLIAIFVTYRKEREYEDRPIEGVDESQIDTEGFTIKHWGALIGAAMAFVVQIAGVRAFGGGVGYWALIIGATVGIIIMLLFGTISYKNFDTTIKKGIHMMGFIAFVMMVANGYGAVMNATGGVGQLVDFALATVGDNRVMAVIVMQLISLLITMGIGTSFGTVPIIAAVFVPICAALGFSPAATVALIASGAAVGDAGTPSSDSTLGPTAGLDADGQHDHIWDTCVPTFIHFNIPIMILGSIAAIIL